jgi:hypothetical protein
MTKKQEGRKPNMSKLCGTTNKKKPGIDTNQASNREIIDQRDTAYEHNRGMEV